MMNLIEWFRTKNMRKSASETNQKIPGGIANLNLVLQKGPDGKVRFKTRIKGEFKLDEENETVKAIQNLIKQMEEESKTNHWSAVIKRPEIIP